MAVSADEFKAGLGKRAGGVAIVTARAGDDIHGMTVTDWAGVSVDPPLVLVCADKGANTLAVIEKGRCFALNVLARDQEALSNKFASKKQEWERFEGLDLVDGPSGAPLLPGTIASLDCTVYAQHDAGDHVIYVGQVEQIVQREGEPLVYFQGQYCGAGQG